MSGGRRMSLTGTDQRRLIRDAVKTAGPGRLGRGTERSSVASSGGTWLPRSAVVGLAVKRHENED